MIRVDLFPSDQLALGGIAAVTADGWPVLITRLPEGYRAILDRCSHGAAALSGGRVRRGNIQCPLHGALFNLADGTCVGGTYMPVRTFAIGEDAGTVWVDVPSSAPGADELPIARA
jgi:anthranilate 1,2-dioxygenase ferredoxin subunit